MILFFFRVRTVRPWAVNSKLSSTMLGVVSGDAESCLGIISVLGYIRLLAPSWWPSSGIYVTNELGFGAVTCPPLSPPAKGFHGCYHTFPIMLLLAAAAAAVSRPGDISRASLPGITARPCRLNSISVATFPPKSHVVEQI